MKPIILFCMLIVSFSAFASRQNPSVIYGDDNRQETIHVSSALYKRLAKSTAAMVPKDSITIKGNTVELHGKPLFETAPASAVMNVCKKERFSEQPSIGHGSGFLVGPKTIATAGHCVMSQSDCDEYVWIFNYASSFENQLSYSVDVSDVYSCRKIIQTKLTRTEDYALVELDRVVNQAPLKLAKTVPPVGTQLVMIGNPNGLPQKVSDGAKIRTIIDNVFLTDLDAFSANSGSAVFRSDTGELVGILVGGNPDYRLNEELQCSEVNVLSNDIGGERVMSFKLFSSLL